MGDPFAALHLIAEKRIAEAAEKGMFDNLPNAGQPLVYEDTSFVPEELRMAYKVLKNAGCLPPEISLRKDASNLLDLLDNCRDEKEKIKQMRKLRLIVEQIQNKSGRRIDLENNDEYYQKILARLAGHEKEMAKGKN